MTKEPTKSVTLSLAQYTRLIQTISLVLARVDGLAARYNSLTAIVGPLRSILDELSTDFKSEYRIEYPAEYTGLTKKTPVRNWELAGKNCPDCGLQMIINPHGIECGNTNCDYVEDLKD